MAAVGNVRQARSAAGVLAEAADIYPYLAFWQPFFHFNQTAFYSESMGTIRATSSISTARRNISSPRAIDLNECTDTMDMSAFRIFVVGGSVAHGGYPSETTYFSQLQRSLQATYPIQVIAAGIGGGSSTEALVLFALTVLPNRPDMVVILDGWNDLGLSTILRRPSWRPVQRFGDLLEAL